MTTMTLDEQKTFTRTYLATPVSVGLARRAAERAVLDWGLKHSQAEDVGLVVSELVTNSIKECPHTEVRLTLTQDVVNTVTVAVKDASPVAPQRKHPTLGDIGGRGLGIVEALACHYGSRPDGPGKTVFAVIPPP